MTLSDLWYLIEQENLISKFRKEDEERNEFYAVCLSLSPSPGGRSSHYATIAQITPSFHLASNLHTRIQHQMTLLPFSSIKSETVIAQYRLEVR